MATAPREASLSSPPSISEGFVSVPGPQPATVEESLDELELVNILRDAAASGSKPLESVLEAVANTARILTGADGTAVGLETDGTILCRAHSGNTAPPLGAPISAESGISGECLRTATMLVCHDAWTDPRVDAEVCRSLGIRAVAAVPVRGSGGVVGILEAFSERPNAFDGEALSSLRELAEIAEIAYRRQASRHEIVAKPQMAAAAPPSRYPTPTAPLGPLPTHATPPLAAEDIVESLSEPSKKRLWLVVAAALVLLLVVAVAWWSWQSPADEASAAAVHNTPAPPAEALPSAAPHETQPKPGPGVPVSHSERQPAIVEDAADVEPIKVTPDHTSTPLSLTDNTHTTLPRTAPEAAVVEPPSASVGPSVNSDQLARLASIPTKMPAAPRISGGVVEPMLIHKVDPTYPTQARSGRISGSVVLSATIKADGSVQNVSVVKGSPVLAQAAKVAVQQWHYRPATLNGNAITIQKEITFLFTLP